jgi:MFS family permease
MVGPALCGLMLLLGPVRWVLVANGATFVVSAALLAGVPLGAASDSVKEEAVDSASAWEAAKQGARYAAREPGVVPLLLISAICVLCSAIINVAEPVLATGPLHAGGSGFSLLITVYGVGLVTGGAYTSRLGSRLSTLRGHFLVGIAGSAVAMFGCASAGTLVLATPPFALGGFANAVIMGPELRLVQELVAERLRGRVFGLRDALESGCFAAAFLTAGALLSIVGPRSVYALSGLLLLGTAALGLLVFKLPEETTMAPRGLSTEPELA